MNNKNVKINSDVNMILKLLCLQFHLVHSFISSISSSSENRHNLLLIVGDISFKCTSSFKIHDYLGGSGQNLYSQLFEKNSVQYHSCQLQEFAQCNALVVKIISSFFHQLGKHKQNHSLQVEIVFHSFQLHLTDLVQQ